MQPKVVLVTGAASGVGRATATLLAQHGYRVFGTSRDGRAANEVPFELLPLELTSDASVRQCVQQVVDRAGRLDVLLNNAGYGVVGAIEETTLQQAQDQYEVFLFGVLRMVKAVLPIMRAQRHGYIVNMSSSASTLALPFVGIYSSGKSAMAGFSEALRYEVQRFGIRVTYLKATAIHTGAAEAIQIAGDRNDAYTPVRDRTLYRITPPDRSARRRQTLRQTLGHPQR
jgi:NAD(P)-dependent dehydrogenase (short-subunit alcohol dehydrogenase family)